MVTHHGVVAKADIAGRGNAVALLDVVVVRVRCTTLFVKAEAVVDGIRDLYLLEAIDIAVVDKDGAVVRAVPAEGRLLRGVRYKHGIVFPNHLLPTEQLRGLAREVHIEGTSLAHLRAAEGGQGLGPALVGVVVGDALAWAGLLHGDNIRGNHLEVHANL